MNQEEDDCAGAIGAFAKAEFHGNTQAIANCSGPVTQNNYYHYEAHSRPGIDSSADGGERVDTVFRDISWEFSFQLAKTAAEKLEPGTREWLMDLMIDRVNNSPCVVLAADAGMGKSCVMGTLAMRRYPLLSKQFGLVQSVGDVGAVHFFQYLDDTERQATTCALSLAKQLCASLPGFRACLPEEEGSTQIWIKTIRKKAAEIKGEKQIRYLLNELIVKPCLKLKRHPDRLLLLIDALDECPDAIDFSAAVESLWAVDANRTKISAPSWLRLIISTRRELNTLERLKRLQSIVLEQRPDATSVKIAAQNSEDLKKVILSRIYNGGESDEEVVKTLLKKSEGIFLWLSYKQDELRELQSKGELLINAVDNLPQGLCQVYVDFFKRVRDELADLEMEKEELKQLYDRTLGLGVIAPRAPIPTDTWRSVIGLAATDKDSKLRLKSVECILFKLLIFDSSTDTIRAPHKSMVDFLKYDENETDRAILDLQIEPLEHHRILGARLMAQLDKLESSRKIWVMGSYTPDEAYALRHVVYHLMKSMSVDKALSCYLTVSKLMRICDAARMDGNVGRVIEEADSLLEQVQGGSSKLHYCMNILRLASRALAIDARMLPAQILGRLGFPPYDDDQTHFAKQAEEWLLENRQQGGPCIARPMHNWLSGLDFAGGSRDTTLCVNLSGTKRVAFGSSGEVCVTDGNVALLYDRKTGELLQEQIRVGAYRDLVNGVAFSQDLRWIVVALANVDVHCAQIWSWQDGQDGRVTVLDNHKLRPTSVALSNDSKWIVIGSEDGTARLWSVEGEPSEIRVLGGGGERMTTIAISEDSKWIATGANVASLWELEPGNHKLDLLCGFKTILSIKFVNPSRIVTLDSDWGRRWDCCMRFWDLLNVANTGRLVDGTPPRLLHKATNATFELSGRVTSWAISGDSKWMVFGTVDDRNYGGGADTRSSVRLWNLESGKEERVLGQHSTLITSVAISADSKWVLSADETAVCLFSVQSAAVRKEEKRIEGHFGRVHRLAISPDKKWAVTLGGRDLAQLWNSETGKGQKIGPFERLNCIYDIADVSISLDSSAIQIRGRDGVLALNISTGADVTAQNLPFREWPLFSDAPRDGNHIFGKDGSSVGFVLDTISGFTDVLLFDDVVFCADDVRGTPVFWKLY